MALGELTCVERFAFAKVRDFMRIESSARAHGSQQFMQQLEQERQELLE